LPRSRHKATPKPQRDAEGSSPGAVRAAGRTSPGGGEAHGPRRNDRGLLQRQLQTLVREENRRLDRFIARLHLKFLLGHYEAEDLYDDVARSLAEYFEADCGTIHLVEYEEVREPGKPTELRTVLRLRGAAGPWERALRPRYFRRKPSDAVTLPEGTGETRPPNLTALIAGERLPMVFPSRLAFQKARRERCQTLHSEKQDEKDADIRAHQVVWHHRNLHSVSRALAGAPLRRPYALGPGAHHPGRVRSYERGVLKVENPRPADRAEFRESHPLECVWLADLWPLVALRPYVDDIVSSRSPYEPLGNNYSWRRRYAEMPRANVQFSVLLEWLAEQEKASVDQDHVWSELKALQGQLHELTNFVVEVETLLVHLQAAEEAVKGCHPPAKGDGARPEPHAHRPSLFNLWNVMQHCQRQVVGHAHRDLECEPSCVLREAALDAGCDPRTVTTRVMRHFRPGDGGSLGVRDLLGEKQYVSRKRLCAASAEALHALRRLARTCREACPRCASTDVQLRQDLAEAARLGKEVDTAIGASAGDLADLSTIVARAAMDAHTFSLVNENDRVRLMYAAHHVVQVLDQQLLRDAQRIGIPAGTDDITFLRLSPFHLQCLRHIKATADEVMQSLAYVVFQHGALQHDLELDISTLALDLADFLRQHRQLAKDGKTGHLRVALFRIQITGAAPAQLMNEVGADPSVLDVRPPLHAELSDDWLELEQLVVDEQHRPINYGTPQWLVDLRDALWELRDRLRLP